MAAPATAYDVFLSHSHVDTEPVEEVADHLKARDLNPWLDRWTLVPGESWQRAMAEGLERADTCAVFMGGQTPSGWFRSEIEKALDRRTRDESFRVIPVLLPGVDERAGRALRDTFLGLYTWVEFKAGCDDAEALHLLVCGVRGVAPGPSPRRAPPSAMVRATRDLRKLMCLREQGLVTESVHHEFQVKILERLLELED